MKKTILFLFFVCFAFNSTLSAQGCTVTSNPQCTAVQVSILFITPNGFPDCRLKIQYRYRICASGVLEFIDWKYISFGSTECGKFFTFIKKNLNEADEFQRFWTALDEQVFLAASSNFAVGLINSGNPNLFSCSLGSDYEVVSTKYFRASCVSVWIGETGGEFDEFIAQQFPCQTTSCCNLLTTSCYDKEKGQIITKVMKEKEGSGLCGGELPPRPPYTPPFNWIAQSPCIVFCNENDPVDAKI